MVTRRTATALLLAAAGAPAFAAKASAVKVPTRGFNLPDWLATSPRIPSDAVLDKLRSTGFETIRLPVDPDFVLSADFASHLSPVIDAVTNRGFNAMVDMHPGASLDFDGDTASASDRIATAWQTLAPLLAGTSPALVYPELLNEPPMPPEIWAPLRDRLAGIVRAACPDHTLIWGPARYQGIWELDATPPPADRNSIVAIHYYSPMGFTHPCENWDDSPVGRLHDLPFPATRDSAAALIKSFEAAGDQPALDELNNELGAPWTNQRIAADFADAARWSRKNCPVILNEFGVLNFCADPTSRGNWLRAVRQAAEANGIGWTYWEADQGFGFIADRTATEGFDDNAIGALLG
jgi:endoglucanase